MRPVPAITTIDRVIKNGKANDAGLTEKRALPEIDLTIAACEVKGTIRSVLHCPPTEGYDFPAASRLPNLGRVIIF